MELSVERKDARSFQCHTTVVAQIRKSVIAIYSNPDLSNDTIIPQLDDGGNYSLQIEHSPIKGASLCQAQIKQMSSRHGF